MAISVLVLALLLPWLLGYLLLTALTGGPESRPDVLRQAGLGFFVGYAFLHGVVKLYDAASGGVEFWPILSIVALLCTCCAALCLWRNPIGRRGLNRPAAPGPTGWRIVFWVFAAWTALHLVLVAIEIVYRPAFPWDAWTTWLYRAKAWFYSGALVSIDDPAAWAAGTPSGPYNAPGGSYPGFVSVVALWSALALGQWHDSLVNSPVLLAGIALCMAFYGQCRHANLPPWMAMLGTYLLVSLPLLGTHLALGGMADVWMAGFVGLGLVELLGGILSGRRRSIVLGVGLVILSLAVKNEGAVWLVAALAFWGTVTWPRLAAVTVLSAIALVAVAALSGIHSIELPGLGRLGLAGGRLHLPFIGDMALAQHDLWKDYRVNFIEGDSWHLLWPLLGLAVIALAFARTCPQRRTLFCLLLVATGVQLAIFQFTEHGQWAEQWTAINRLPLQVVPAILFTLLLAADGLRRAWARPGEVGTGMAHKLLVPVAGLALTLAGLLLYLESRYPAVEQDPVRFQGENLRIIVGSGQRVGDSVRVTGFRDTVAVLSSGRTRLDSSQLSVVEMRIPGAAANASRVRFFWRTASEPDSVSAIEFQGRDYIRSNLDASLGWRGTITEVGIMLFDRGGKAVEVSELALSPPSLGGSVRTLWYDWTLFEGWSQASPNFILAGSKDATVPLPLVVAAWIVVSALFACMLRRKLPRPVSLVMALSVAGWMLLDLRWTGIRLLQAGDTISFYRGGDRAYLDLPTEEAFLLERVATSKRLINDPGDAVLVLAERGENDFLVWRALYHYLPTPAFAHPGALDDAPRQPGDYALIITPVQSKPGRQRSTAQALARGLASRRGQRVSVMDASDAGVFLRLESRGE